MEVTCPPTGVYVRLAKLMAARAQPRMPQIEDFPPIAQRQMAAQQQIDLPLQPSSTRMTGSE